MAPKTCSITSYDCVPAPSQSPKPCHLSTTTFEEGYEPAGLRSRTLATSLHGFVRYGCPDVSSQVDFSSVIARLDLGDIYIGRLKDGQEVAIKCINMTMPSRGASSLLKSAAKELHTWSKCKHENVQQLLGLASFRDRVAMVSPWMTKGTVLDYVGRHPDADRLNLCVGIAAGLAYLHLSRPKIIHGDLKAENILISANGVAKLTDFGCSLIDNCVIPSPRRGTIRWMAPELINPSPNNPQTDVYALGMTMLEIITGEPPFADLSDEAAFAKIMVLRQTPNRPKCCIPSTDGGDKLWGLLYECWAADPSNRASAKHVENTLGQLQLNWDELQPGTHSRFATTKCPPLCAGPNPVDEGYLG